MPKPDEKMQMIGTAVILQAEQERRKVISEANIKREQAVGAHRKQLLKELFDEMQAQTRSVKQQAVRERAQAETRAHRELLSRRSELTASVFSSAKAKLFEYASTEAYRTALLDRLRALAGRYDHAASTVLLRADDLSLAPRIEALLPGCVVKASRAIHIGGFILRNPGAGIQLDETLDSRLQQQRPWFLQSCGLRVDQ